MADLYSNEWSDRYVRPSIPADWLHMIAFKATYTLTGSELTGDVLHLFKVPKGFMPAGGLVGYTDAASSGAFTVSVGYDSDADALMAATDIGGGIGFKLLCDGTSGVIHATSSGETDVIATLSGTIGTIDPGESFYVVLYGFQQGEPLVADA